MIPEQRESYDNSKSNLINELEKYLRSEADYDSLSNYNIKDAIEQRLIMKAKDWCMKHNCMLTDGDCVQCSQEAIQRFMSNWKDKKPGEDDRGDRLGKSW